MRFTSATYTIVLGLVASACAAPLGVDSESLETRAIDGESLFEFARGEPESLDTRGLTHATFGKDIEITYESTNAVPHPAPAAKVQEAVAKLIKEAGSKLDTHEAKLHPKNQWKGALDHVTFSFEWKACNGRCKGVVDGDGEGSLTTQDGKVLFSNSRAPVGISIHPA